MTVVEPSKPNVQVYETRTFETLGLHQSLKMYVSNPLLGSELILSERETASLIHARKPDVHDLPCMIDVLRKYNGLCCGLDSVPTSSVGVGQLALGLHSKTQRSEKNSVHTLFT